MYITCKSCGKQIDVNSKFCVYCGSPIIQQTINNSTSEQRATNRCPRCGQANISTAQFCSNCGTSIKLKQNPALRIFASLKENRPLIIVIGVSILFTSLFYFIYRESLISSGQKKAIDFVKTRLAEDEERLELPLPTKNDKFAAEHLEGDFYLVYFDTYMMEEISGGKSVPVDRFTGAQLVNIKSGEIRNGFDDPMSSDRAYEIKNQKEEEFEKFYQKMRKQMFYPNN